MVLKRVAFLNSNDSIKTVTLEHQKRYNRGRTGKSYNENRVICNHYRISLRAPCSTLFGIGVYMFQFLFSGYNVKVRHKLLSRAIGTFEEENKAYLLISWLLWVLPMTVTIAALMDAILVYCFMKWFHPWAGILGT